MKLLRTFLFGFLFLAMNAYGQSIEGTVKDADGNPVPYVKVYAINFTNVGAVTNENGEFFFGCDFGNYDLLFKCVGFEDFKVNVTVATQTPTQVHVVMLQKDNQLDEVNVSEKKKNLGWEIVQHVIDNKKNFADQYEGYTCSVYIKGVETFDVKEKKPKEEEEDDGQPKDLFEEQKDEIKNQIEGEKSRLNMVEIGLTMHVQMPNKIKEIRNAYQTIGKPDQVYFQSTVNGEFNFYKGLIRKDDLHTSPIVSPLHPSGILSYKYKLVDIITEGNDTIYKIEIGARDYGTSTMEGHLYIKKHEWVLTKIDVKLHKGNLKIYDNFRIIQEYEQIDSIWVVSKQIFEYDTKYGKETVHGTTTVVYTDYIFNPDFPEKFFNNELGSTVEGAYERDSTFWEDVRPIPLTEEELRKKFVQDSLTAIYTRKEYLDSVDAVFNKITFLKVLYFGVTHRNRDKKTQWYLSSLADFWEPIGVGGMRIGPGFDYFKKWENQQWMDLGGDITIGFNNWDPRGRFRFSHMFNPKKFSSYMVWGSRDVDMVNSYTAYMQSIKRSNFYLNQQGGAYARTELVNGLFLSGGFRFEHRSSLDSLKFSHLFDDQLENDLPISFDPYNAVRSSVTLSYTPFQKYISEPYRKVILGSRWPTITLYWEKGWNGLLKSVVDFDYISLSIDQEIQIGTLGESYYVLRGGSFINQDSVFYFDRKFFRESDDGFFRFLLSNPLYSFQNLDSSYETENWYAEFHYIHHFNGALINKIPFMKKTGIKELVGGGFIFLPEHDNYFYTELYFGLERTFKIARQRLRIGGYVIFSVANNAFALPDESKPKNMQFKISFDVMDERDLKFNF
ncbi:MAG: carboxypeptidase-like regulatory domain-containing protein [Crocinitomicaceae bacterium]|nr:carboxypeptidase-like regulatory domain-containing protein [Crocinitomicaceae bacterium]MBK8926721.1 carboxypeptidase-like regulatory domain-containing protein [Crocinitomicaceae bacterium]